MWSIIMSRAILGVEFRGSGNRGLRCAMTDQLSTGALLVLFIRQMVIHELGPNDGSRHGEKRRSGCTCLGVDTEWTECTDDLI